MSETTTPSTGITTTQPEVDPLQQWKAAERAQQQVVIKTQVALVKARVNLHNMKGTEAEKEALHAIVQEFPKGILFSVAKSAFDLTTDLSDAREELVKDGKIKTDDKKRGMTLFPVVPTEVVTK